MAQGPCAMHPESNLMVRFPRVSPRPAGSRPGCLLSSRTSLVSRSTTTAMPSTTTTVTHPDGTCITCTTDDGGAQQQKVKFSYFPLKARGFPILLALEVGGVEYEADIVQMENCKRRSAPVPPARLRSAVLLPPARLLRPCRLPPRARVPPAALAVPGQAGGTEAQQGARADTAQQGGRAEARAAQQHSGSTAGRAGTRALAAAKV